MKFESKFKHFHWTKCIWKCFLSRPQCVKRIPTSDFQKQQDKIKMLDKWIYNKTYKPWNSNWTFSVSRVLIHRHWDIRHQTANPIQWGMQPWCSLLGLLLWCSIFKSSHRNSSQDWLPVDDMVYVRYNFHWIDEIKIFFYQMRQSFLLLKYIK